jgi:hypothetical protein
MNAFTKKELEEIKRCLKYMINGGVTPYSLLTIAINKKIQSMLDNYCEHEHGKSNLNEVNAPPNTLPNTKCYKCKSEFYVHPLCSINADFILDCNLHRGVT